MSIHQAVAILSQTTDRIVWVQGDGSMMAVYDTPFGRLGGLTRER